MLRVLSAAFRGTARASFSSASLKFPEPTVPTIFTNFHVSKNAFKSDARFFSLLYKPSIIGDNVSANNVNSFFRPSLFPIISKPEVRANQVPVRNLVKYTRHKGKRKTVRAVLKRFYRLNWGMWIRTKAGRTKKLWRKTINRKRRLRRHVFTTPKQSHLLDTLVCKYWRRPKFFVDDPYNPYHERESYPTTRKKPLPAP